MGALRAKCSGRLPTPSRQQEKNTARQDQTGKASASDRARDTTGGDRRVVVSLKATSTPVVQDKLSDGLPRVGMDVEIICNLVASRNDEIARKCAEKRRTIVHEDYVGGVRRSPSKANVTDRVCHRHYDIGCYVVATWRVVATRIDEISGRRREP